MSKLDVEGFYPGYEAAMAFYAGMTSNSSKEHYSPPEVAPSLGDHNPLLYSPNLGNTEHISAIKMVTLSRIKQIGGLEPARLDSIVVKNIHGNPPANESRFIARFESKE